MILRNNTVNQFYATASERSEIAASGGTPYFILSMENQETKTVKHVIPTILSRNNRADKLELTLSGSNENLLNGVLTLDSTAMHTYTIYESHSQAFNPTGKILEYGIIMIEQNNNNNLEYTGGSSTYLSYGN
jgi:hypothetical protein